MATADNLNLLCSVLIVSVEGVGEHLIANLLHQSSKKHNHTLQMYHSRRPRLEKRDKEDEVNIDFIIYIIDPTVKHSVAQSESQLADVNAKYSLGNACVVVTQNKNKCNWVIGTEELLSRVRNSNLIPIFVHLEEEAHRNLLQQKLRVLIETATGIKPGGSSLLMSSKILTKST